MNVLRRLNKSITDLTASGSILSASTVNKASEADEFAAAFNYPSVGNTRPDVCNLVSLVGRSDSHYTAAFDSSFSVSISVGIDAGTTGEKFWIKTSGQPVGYTSGTISGSGGGYSYSGSFGVNVP